MKISLITATLGRITEFETLIISLCAQTYKNFEFIVIDQNTHFDLQKLIQKYSNKININYIRSDIKGLSYNRNIGLLQSTGDIFAFPDDDCYYKEDVLETAAQAFHNNPNMLFCTLPIYDTVNTDHCHIFKHGNPCIKRNQIHKYCISYNFFIKQSQTVFDDRLGVGTEFSSGEETDYLFSVVDCKSSGLYIDKSKIYHPKNDLYDITPDRAYKYGLGFGALFKKEILVRHHYSGFCRFLYYLLRSFAGAIIRPSKRNIYINTLKGRIRGFIKFRIK